MFPELWIVRTSPNLESVKVVFPAALLIVPTPLIDTFLIIEFLPLTVKDSAVILATLAPSWTVKVPVVVLLDTIELEPALIDFAVLL